GPIAEVAPRLADARHALSLAASLGIGDRVLAAPLVSARMVLNRLAGDALAEELVRVEIGKLIEYDRRHGTGLVRTVHTYLSHGSSTSRAAQALGCSRQSLYNRKAMTERLIGRFDTPERHANLVLALELHGLRQRFESGAAPHA
ncbi:MAG: helix-turn-helix domain-containing protein, partial [Actinomycetia bacterium]|nr:helix-turn-helix domain-containing protein [Actinomycetes bacterium]